MQVNVPGYGIWGLGSPFSALNKPGNIFFLNDQAIYGANNQAIAAKNPQTPARTGNLVITFCKDYNGDIVVVGPHHSESVPTLLALVAPPTTTFIHTGYNISWTVSGNGQALGARDARVDEYSVQRAGSITPATGNATIFNVVGSCSLLIVEGYTTVVFPATANTLQLAAVSTGLTAVNLCAASASIANAAVGTIFSLTGVLTDPMVISPNQVRVAQAGQIVVNTGIIRLATTGTSLTGQIAWTLRYRPNVPGAYIAAA